MQKRPLGDSGLEVAPLVFGGNVFGWTADKPTSFRLLDAFVAAGLNLIDTADVYSSFVPGNKGGESETIIGNWLAARPGVRAKVLIATKCGVEFGTKPGTGGVNLSRPYIVKSVEDSLRRLRTDYIDLYQAHRDDENTPFAETLGAYATLIEQGKIRAVGASNFTTPRLAEALRVSTQQGLPRFESLQPWFNLYDQDPFDTELQSLCIRERIGVITYFSLGCGFLTGKYRTEADLAGRPRAYRVKEMMNPRGFRILAALDGVARELNATPAQVALAWLMAHPAVTAPIASATTEPQLAELVGATRLQLSAEARDRLNTASAPD